MLPKGTARILDPELLEPISWFSGIEPNRPAHNLPVEKPPKLMTATPQPGCQKSNSTAQLKPGGLSNHQSPGHEQNPPPFPEILRAVALAVGF